MVVLLSAVQECEGRYLDGGIGRRKWWDGVL